MGVVASFNYALWQSRYPEFASISSDLAQEYFNEATLYLANDGSGPVYNAGQQLLLLNMLTAHVAKLSATTAGPSGTVTLASPLVGRISSATEGSVSVSAEVASGGSTSALYGYLSQTPYGLSFWSATAQYRTMRYVPGRRACAGYGSAGGYGFGGYGRW